MDTKGLDAYYERSLARLKLSKDDLVDQTLSELEESLSRLNILIENHASLGIMKVSVASEGQALIAKSTAESLFEYTAMPLLLERQVTISGLLRERRRESRIIDLQTLVQSVEQSELRRSLSAELDSLSRAVNANMNALDIDVKRAFIAMPMMPQSPELIDVLDAIQSAAAGVGIEAKRVDESELNSRITDTMLKELDRSGHVVVDLTYGRPNVYYEAGYAHGSGKLPIFIARSGTEIHFDLKDYPIIYFSNLRDLKTRLTARFKGPDRSGA